MSALTRLRKRVRQGTPVAEEVYREAAEATTRETKRRHGLGSRLSHWLLVVTFVLLLASGLMMWGGWYGPVFTELWGGYYVAFGVHMWAGILVLAVAFVLFPFYHVVVDGHNPVPTGEDVRTVLAILAAFVGLRGYVSGYHRARRTWDADDGEWVAYHPAQKLFWWTQLVLFALLAFTGFAMYDRMVADAPVWIGWLGAPAAWMAPETQLQTHIFFAFALTAAVAMHIYFAVLPSNWDVLKSMFTGDVEAYVVGEAAERGEPSGASGASRTDETRGETGFRWVGDDP